LTGTFEVLEGIEHESHAHRHEFVADGDSEESEDDAVTFLDQEGHEVDSFLISHRCSPLEKAVKALNPL